MTRKRVAPIFLPGRKLLLISLLLIPLTLRAETKVPPEKELKAMVRDTLLAFNKGVQEKTDDDE